MVVLSERVLNRTTLHRQLLLERGAHRPLDVIELLVGMQGQDPELPYVGLWNRISGFAMADLTTLVEQTAIVRGTMYRCTQHILTRRDYLWIRPLLDDMLARMRRGFFGRTTASADPAELVRITRELLAERSLTRTELGKALAERWPQHEGIWLARAAQVAVPVVHPHPDGTWGHRGPTSIALAERVLGEDFDRTGTLADLALRYLVAFGPASVKDMQAWSGLTRMREVFEDLRPRLVTYADEAGAELFDLPDRELTDPDVPAPVRFLAGFDNVTFGYANRSRVIADEYRPALVEQAALTVDGKVRGVWKMRAGILIVTLFEKLTAAQEEAVAAEGEKLRRFTGMDRIEINRR